MVSDREPRYQLLDSNGTVVGSLYEKSNGKLALQDGNTDTEVVFDGDTIGSGGESLDIDSLASGLKVLDLVDDSSGNTVYDSSSETLGDGNQDVNANSISTDNATIDGKKGIGVPDSSNTASPGFDTFRQPSADRPVMLLVEIEVETDGTDDGKVQVDVDEGGGTIPNYRYGIAQVPAGAGGGARNEDTVVGLLPEGAQYRVVNDSDPNNNNQIKAVREFIL